MPKGICDAKMTPKQALEVGLQVDIEAIDPAMREPMAQELKTELSAANPHMLNDSMITAKLIEANAVVGIVPVDTNGGGKMQIAPAGPDKIGILRTICHTVTNKSVFELRGPDQLSKERPDGLAVHGRHMAENRLPAQDIHRAVKVCPIKTLLEGFDDALAPREGGRPGGGRRRSNTSTPPVLKVWSHA